jgi:hypothetical protein
MNVLPEAPGGRVSGRLGKHHANTGGLDLDNTRILQGQWYEGTNEDIAFRARSPCCRFRDGCPTAIVRAAAWLPLAGPRAAALAQK